MEDWKVIDLYNGELHDILLGTPFSGDIDTECLSYALKKAVQAIIDLADASEVTAMVDNLPEHILDVLAVENGIVWYDPDADIDVKRNLIKSATNVHMQLGTKKAVEQVCNDYYGDSEVLEWFEYGGTPGHFKVNVLSEDIHIEIPDKFVEILRKVKRQSAIMDGIDFVWTIYNYMHIGAEQKQSLIAPDIPEYEEEEE